MHKKALVKCSSNTFVDSVQMLQNMLQHSIVQTIKIKKRWGISTSSLSTLHQKFEPWKRNSTERLPIWKINSMIVSLHLSKSSRLSSANSSTQQTLSLTGLWRWHLARLMNLFSISTISSTNVTTTLSRTSKNRGISLRLRTEVYLSAHQSSQHLSQS